MQTIAVSSSRPAPMTATLRTKGENLRRFFSRHSEEELRSFLAGHLAEAVARDLPAGPVPHGVDG